MYSATLVRFPKSCVAVAVMVLPLKRSPGHIMEENHFPYNTFLWEGIDGTSIPAHIFTDYNSQTRPSALLERWNTRLQTSGHR